ncbi:MAG: hypothetical protein HYY06_15670 [Deltaproteobacteria bacterium]|nr:hypothetical protein [Deltaproteobacteria bacterium]
MRVGILAFALTAGCSGDVTEVPVRLGNGESCAGLLSAVDARFCTEVASGEEMRSVRARPIRFESSEDIDTLDVPDTCQALPPGTTTATAVLDAFREDGFFAKGIPADVPTTLQIIGFEGEECPELGGDTVVPMCGYTLPVIEAGEIPEEGVEACFVCSRPAVGQCIRAPTLDEL